MIRDNLFELVFIGVIGFVLIGVPSVLLRFEYVSSEASIDQLRRDVRNVNVAESEDVIGQVTDANQQIARMRRWNNIPLAQIFIPNGWDSIALIELPTREK